MAITYLGNIKGQKGDKGDRGEQGLPGVNAVANDTATATYLNSSGSETHDAAVQLSKTVAAQVTSEQVRGFAALKRALDDGARSTGIQVLSDSTGVSADRWPHRLAQMIATDYPGLTVRVKPWNVSTDDYDPAVVIQTGPAGEMYLDAAETTTNPLTYPGVQPASGDLDLRFDLSMADWQPATASQLGVRAGTASTSTPQSWWVGITTTGALTFSYSTDGANLVTRTSTGVNTFTANQRAWVRVVFIGDNGAGGHDVRFYVSTDGATWIALGSTVTTAGTVSLYNGGLFQFGGRGAQPNTLKLYQAEYRDGELGPCMAPSLPDLWQPNLLSGTDMPVVGSPVVTVMNGAISGGAFSEGAKLLNDPATLPTMLGFDTGQAVTILSSSHNEGVKTGRDWFAKYTAWAASVEEAVPAPIVVTAQNPERAAAVNHVWHAQRARDTLTLARANGYGFIDIFSAFTANPAWATELMGDDVHPNSAGSQLWAETIYSALMLA